MRRSEPALLEGDAPSRKSRPIAQITLRHAVCLPVGPNTTNETVSRTPEFGLANTETIMRSAGINSYLQHFHMRNESWASNKS